MKSYVDSYGLIAPPAAKSSWRVVTYSRIQKPTEESKGRGIRDGGPLSVIPVGNVIKREVPWSGHREVFLISGVA